MLTINPHSSTPIYQQIIDAVKESVALGIFKEGDKLPTVRELAAQLTINPNTIAKAYQKMEQEGLIITMRSRGTFIVSNHLISSEKAQELLMASIDKLIIDAYHMGIKSDDLIDLFEKRLDTWEHERRK